MSLEQKFTLSADTVVNWLAKLRKSGELPLPLMAVVAFIEQLRGKRIEIVVRTVDAAEEKTK